MSRPTVGSFCSGIDGLGLGLERAGMRVVWHSETDPYCCRVLEKRWPHVPNLGDIRTVDWSSVERPDIVCGGYPCQPFSLAGARRGEDDPRHLWPYVLAALRVLRPRFAVLENVPGHRSLGFGRVLGDLAESGFDAEWESIPASFVGAPHLRDRVFVIAYPNSESEPERPVDAFPRQRFMVPDSCGAELWQQPVAVTGRCGTAGARDDGPQRTMAYADSSRLSLVPGCEAFPERARRGTVGDGGWWSSEPDVGRVADGIPSRVDRLRGLGNAVVPQVAQFIGEQLLAAVVGVQAEAGE